MSYVTNVLVSVGYSEDTEEILGIRFEEGGRSQTLADLTSLSNGAAWGGSKYPECAVFGAAFNYTSVDTILNTLRGHEWRDPSSVQVFIMTEEDDVFGIHSL